MASAVNADHADTADTASDALKLGGYDASDYMRKDEVKTIKSSYETLEWDGAGTYSWTVPEGVTKINVTTVGGGGGAGYLRNYTLVNTSGTIINMYPGGNGGETTEGVVLDVNAGDLIKIIIGSGGAPAFPYPGWAACSSYYPSMPQYQGSGKSGTESYITINGIKQSGTIAKGGPGGDVSTRRIGDAPPGDGIADYWWYGNTSRTGKNGGIGGSSDTAVGGSSGYGGNGYSGDGGHPQITSSPIRHGCTNALEHYEYAGGGGSYGHGASPGDLRAPTRGGGGAHYAGGNWNGASGYARISYTRMYSD